MNHALLSPSAAHRWLKCTPSARLALKYGDKTSTYAEEGTVAHNLGELLLKEALGLITKQRYKKDFRALEASEFYNKEMLEYCKDYRDYVLEQRNRLIAEDKGEVKIYIEQKINLDPMIRSSFGTADVYIHNDQTLIDIDLKFGKGVEVSPVKNEQFMLYALGIKSKLYEEGTKVKLIELHVFQPRLNNIESWACTNVELNTWYNDVVRDASNAAYDGTGEYKAGDHCLFCPAKGNCKTFAEFNLSKIDEKFSLPNSLDKEFISEIIANASLFKSWLKSVEDFALSEAKKGVKFPGLKMVAGRSNRRIENPKMAGIQLLLSGLTKADVYKPTELRTITDLEKIVGKNELYELIGDFIIKPDGAPTLAPESDKRPEIGLGKALDAFDDLFQK